MTDDDSHLSSRQTRRSLLQTAAGGVAAAVGLSGCVSGPLDSGPDWGSGGLDDPDEPAAGYASFFALWDITNRIGGDRFQFENPVETGAIGHGWTPDGDLVPEVAETDAFVYLDTPEFAWAQDAAETLASDFDSFPIIDGLEAVQSHLLSFDTGSIPSPEIEDVPPDSIRFEEWDIYDLSDASQLGYWHIDHWHGGLPDVALGDFVPVGFVLYDDRERVVRLGDRYTFDARLADGSDDVVEIESVGDRVRFTGQSLGEVGVVFEIYHNDELVYETTEEPTRLTVVEETEGESDTDEFHDPHAWVDPVLMGLIATHVADRLGEIDPDNADRYAANAATVTDELDEVDRRLREVVADAALDVAVFAGHDSYAYVENRYAFRLETPVGVSPDAAVSNDDIAGLLETIETHGIDTVLYDPFEAPTVGESVPQMVETIIENSDVDNAAPLTPLAGTTEAWQDRGWGYVEQMHEINIPSLERALNPE